MHRLSIVVFVVLLLTGCKPPPSNNHGHSHGPSGGHESGGHSHGDGGHSHGGEAIRQITLWDDDVELYVEHKPFIEGKRTRLVTHVTLLGEWVPKTSGEIGIQLKKDGEAAIEVKDEPARDGVYLPIISFPKAGTWDILIEVPLDNGTVSRQVLSNIKVYKNQHDADHDNVPEADGIAFLKEQQWRTHFASDFVVRKSFRESLMANARIDARADGQVMIHAPLNGRIASTQIPYVGSKLDKGQDLLYLIPRLDQSIDPASLTASVEKAKLALAHAEAELARVQRLYEKEAVPKNRLIEAELARNTAQAEFTSAEKRHQQFFAVNHETETFEKGRITLETPLAGTLIESHAVAGALVSEGDSLFHVIDMTRLWLTVNVPEGDIAKIRDANGAWFLLADQLFEVGEGHGGRLVAFGGKIDPVRRTVPLIFEIPNPDGLLKVGMFVQASVYTGKASDGLAIPKSAVVEEAGQTVVYVQLNGETFERRQVKLGMTEGKHIQVLTGLEEGERVVSRGAYQVRLAGAATAVPSHGHAH